MPVTKLHLPKSGQNTAIMRDDDHPALGFPPGGAIFNCRIYLDEEAAQHCRSLRETDE
jgi:hypothetical protein